MVRFQSRRFECVPQDRGGDPYPKGEESVSIWVEIDASIHGISRIFREKLDQKFETVSFKGDRTNVLLHTTVEQIDKLYTNRMFKCSNVRERGVLAASGIHHQTPPLVLGFALGAFLEPSFEDSLRIQQKQSVFEKIATLPAWPPFLRLGDAEGEGGRTISRAL